jgi:hypothetical protein
MSKTIREAFSIRIQRKLIASSAGSDIPHRIRAARDFHRIGLGSSIQDLIQFGR